jgi:ATP-dependent Clp protease ATP-binding subunit ClpX
MTTTENETTPQEQNPVIRCAFCQKPTTEVSKMVAGPGVYICDQCVSLCVEIINEGSMASTEMPKRARWEERLSDDELLAALPGIAATSASVERELATWVRSARNRGITWTRIGAAMGMTRQSAWERFSGEE